MSHEVKGSTLKQNMKIENFHRDPEAINNKKKKYLELNFRYSLDKLKSGMKTTRVKSQ